MPDATARLRPRPEPRSPAAARTEVVLSLRAQKEGQIETQPVKSSDEPDLLRVPGRIALADNRSWRVGVRTDGLVVAVMAEAGDYVRKGQVLARYHADEVRDSRALYRAAQAEVARAQSNAALAQRNVTRAETLLDLKAASQQQVEQARQELVVAQTAVRNAQIEVDRLKDLLEDDLRVPADPKPGDETADQVPITRARPAATSSKRTSRSAKRSTRWTTPSSSAICRRCGCSRRYGRTSLGSCAWGSQCA